jgi:hypothetical protein
MSEDFLNSVPIEKNPHDGLDKQFKTIKEVHRSFKVILSNSSTYIIVVAVHNDQSKNFINKINCKKGIPIGGYAYDSQSDSYLYECADFFHLGHVPVSFMVEQKENDFWGFYVPMPEVTIRKFLDDMQKNELKKFKNHFKSNEYKIRYVQMIDPNI